MEILCEIQKRYNEFSDKEKAIADYIMQYKEVIKNEYNGILYPVKNNDLFSEAIESVINNKNIFFEMKKNCINEAKKYTPENALKPLYSLIK